MKRAQTSFMTSINTDTGVTGLQVTEKTPVRAPTTAEVRSTGFEIFESNNFNVKSCVECCSYILQHSDGAVAQQDAPVPTGQSFVEWDCFQFNMKPVQVHSLL